MDALAPSARAQTCECGVREPDCESAFLPPGAGLYPRLGPSSERARQQPPCWSRDRHMPPWLPAGRRRHASERRALLASGPARRWLLFQSPWPMQRPGPGKNAPSRLQLEFKLSVPRTPPVAPAGRGSPLAGRPGRGRSGSRHARPAAGGARIGQRDRDAAAPARGAGWACPAAATNSARPSPGRPLAC